MCRKKTHSNGLLLEATVLDVVTNLQLENGNFLRAKPTDFPQRAGVHKLKPAVT
jgi:hypothetical protein